MPYFPMFLDAARMQVLVVGGGAVAAAKLETLAGCGAAVTVVAPRISDGVRSLAAVHGCVVLEQAYRPELLEGRTLVVAAVDDPALGVRIAADARAAGLPVNVVDNPALCDFIFPAVIRRGGMQIAVSSGGTSPVLARLLKQEIENMLPEQLDRLAAYIATKTDAVRAALAELQPRRLFWERLIRGPVGAAVLSGDLDTADRRFDAALQSAGTAPQAALYLLRIPADPDLVTIRAVRLLGRADLVLADQGIAPDWLERYARRDAVKCVIAPLAGDVEEVPARIGAALREGLLVACLFTADDPQCGHRAAEAAAVARHLQVSCISV